MSFSYMEANGNARDLYPCLRDGCSCAGVFYKDFGGTSSSIRITVSLDASRVDPSRVDAVCEQFRLGAPDVDFVYTCASPGQTGSEIRQGFVVKSYWVEGDARPVIGGGGGGGGAASSDSVSSASSSSSLGGSWILLVRPKHITNQGLAQLRVAVGPNMVWSDAFEVRTKPSEWLLLQTLPAAWGEAEVRECIRRHQASGAKAPRAVVMRKGLGCTERHALVRMKDRTEVSGVWQRFRVGSLHRDSDEAAIVMSLAGSISRQFKEDPTLTFLPTPSAPGKHSAVKYLQAMRPVVEAVAPAPAEKASVVLPVALGDTDVSVESESDFAVSPRSESKAAVPCIPIVLDDCTAPVAPAPLGPLPPRRRKRRIDECSESVSSSSSSSSSSESSFSQSDDSVASPLGSPLALAAPARVVLPVDYSDSHAHLRRALSIPGTAGPVALPVQANAEFATAAADACALEAELELIHAAPEDWNWLVDDSAAFDLESAGSPTKALAMNFDDADLFLHDDYFGAASQRDEAPMDLFALGSLEGGLEGGVSFP